jgi:hypothetical protein
MPLQTDDTRLIAQAHAYVVELYREVSAENIANVGTQNQVVDFILADPELCRAIARWAETEQIGEATMAPPKKLPQDDLYHRLRSRLVAIIGPPVIGIKPTPNG